MRQSTVRHALLLLPFGLPQVAQPAPIATEEAILLSPFTVDASAEKGYLATQTLGGTRLKTDLKDIGSALTIFTEPRTFTLTSMFKF